MTVMTTSVLVRDATPADFSAVQAVSAAANEEYREHMAPALFAGYLANVTDVDGRARSGQVLVAELAGKLVGTVTFYPDAGAEGMPLHVPPRTAGFRAMAVRPDARGAGLGHRLVVACVDRARAAGAERLLLHTADFLTAAIALYQRHGFVREPAYDFDASPFFGGAEADELIALALILPLRSADADAFHDALSLMSAVGSTSGADLRRWLIGDERDPRAQHAPQDVGDQRRRQVVAEHVSRGGPPQELRRSGPPATSPEGSTNHSTRNWKGPGRQGC